MNEIERKKLLKTQTSVMRGKTGVNKTPSIKIKTVVKTIVR